MGSKIRKQIYIATAQEKQLKRLTALTGLSEAEIIRQALDEHTANYRLVARNLAAWDAEKSFLEDLIAKGPVSGNRNWKREDAYDR